VINGIEQGLFVVRPRATPRPPSSDLTVSIAGPGTAALTDAGWSFVIRVVNEGTDVLSEARVIEMPPASSRLLSARATQGECSLSSVVSCELGNLAPGSEAFVVVTIQGSAEADLVSTALAGARARDGVKRERSAATMTRVVRQTPGLALRRPAGDTQFRIGRNNTIQWTLRGVAGGVSIDLSRDDGVTWTRLSADAENVGFFDWTGVGATTARARIRVTSLANPDLTQTSPAFSIVAR
jgi:hypothetical protein